LVFKHFCTASISDEEADRKHPLIAKYFCQAHHLILSPQIFQTTKLLLIQIQVFLKS